MSFEELEKDLEDENETLIHLQFSLKRDMERKEEYKNGSTPWDNGAIDSYERRIPLLTDRIERLKDYIKDKHIQLEMERFEQRDDRVQRNRLVNTFITMCCVAAVCMSSFTINYLLH